MIQIRPEQMEVLDQLAVVDFRERAAEHLSRCFPREFSAKAPAERAAFVEEGLARAKRHGIGAERDVIRFLDLDVVLGARWDKSAQLPWAVALLKDRDRTSGQKLEQIWERAKAELSRRRTSAPR